MMTHLVFVYGSLKEGFHNHRLLRKNEAMGLGAATTANPALMLAGPGYPFLIDPEGHAADLGDFVGRVRGELYEVDDELLADLDRLEGHPEYYRRKEVEIVPEDHPERVMAWVYFLPADTLEDAHRIPLPVMPDAEGIVEWTVERAYGPDDAHDIPDDLDAYELSGEE